MKRGEDRRKSSPRGDVNDPDRVHQVMLSRMGLLEDPEGMKFDDGKLAYDLLDDAAEDEFVAVLTFGAVKYDPGNWRKVASRRYRAAVRRHLSRYFQGEELDSETGLHHLAHAICCIHFMLGIELATENGKMLRDTLPRRLQRALETARKMRAEREKKARAG